MNLTDYSDTCTCSPALREDDIKRWFFQAFSSYHEEREVVISDLQFLKDSCLDTEKQRVDLEAIQTEMEIVSEALKQCIRENAAASISEDEYRSRYDSLYAKYEDLERQNQELSDKITNAAIEAAAIDEVISCLISTDSPPMEFDPMLWRTLVEKVLVGADGTVVFHMVGGKKYQFTVY